MGLIEDVTNLLTAPLEAIGAHLESVSLLMKKGQSILEVLVDHIDGVNDLDFIVKVTELIDPIIDESNLFNSSYVLDVATAGAEKKVAINDLAKHVKGYLKFHLRKPYRGENILLATLEKVNNENITINGRLKGQKYQTNILLEDIDKVFTAIKF